MADTIDEQLTKYLADAHSIEEQALQQLRGAPDAVSDPELAGIFREHLVETEEHERLVRSRLEEHDSDPSRLKDLLMRVGGAGFLLFAKAQPDTSGKLVAHAYSYEHLELAAYELLPRVAERAGDTADSRDGASRSATRRSAMAKRLEDELRPRRRARRCGEVGRDDLDEQLEQVPRATRTRSRRRRCSCSRRAPQLSGDPDAEPHLRASTSRRRTSTQRLVEQRLDARGGDPTGAQGRGDARRRAELGHVLPAPSRHVRQARRLRVRVRAPRDRRLRGAEARGAERVGDEETVQHGRDRSSAPERAAAQKLYGAFDRAVDASLRRGRASPRTAP